MGTRNLTVVYDKNGDLKVAQYGQWDGYPSYTGVGILDFLKSQKAYTLRHHRLSGCRFLSQEETDALSKQPNVFSWHPQFSRNLGYQILGLIASGPDGGIVLQDSFDFGGDSLFCEWAYVIDYSSNKFEVYRGFQKQTYQNRWMNFADPSAEHKNVARVADWELGNLPHVDHFLEALKNDGEEELISLDPVYDTEVKVQSWA